MLDNMNPAMKYKVFELIFYEKLSQYPIFENSHKNEIIEMSTLMKSKLSVSDEEIIT